MRVQLLQLGKREDIRGGADDLQRHGQGGSLRRLQVSLQISFLVVQQTESVPT
jgi:hypothetical protein